MRLDLQGEPERDFLKEAFDIILGKSPLLAQRGHLLALKEFYEAGETAPEVENSVEGVRGL